MTIDVARFNATTDEEIERQMIEDGTADLDWSKAVRSPARALVIPENHVISLKKAEALLWEEYAMRGRPEHKAAAEAVHALLADGAAC